MTKLDPELIPPGRYCYQFVPLAPGEVSLPAGPEFGRLQRECTSRLPNAKEVLCPYVERTGYGTVRCMYQGNEALRFGQDREHLATALTARFGTPAAIDWFDEDSPLGDLIKTCRHGGMTEEDPDDPASASNRDPALVWPHFAHLDGLMPGEWVESREWGLGLVWDVDFTSAGPTARIEWASKRCMSVSLNDVPLRRVAPMRLDQESIWRAGDAADIQQLAVAQAPELSQELMARLPWESFTGLQGPFTEGAGPMRKAVAPSVQAIAPPFKALRSVLYGALMPGFSVPEVWQSLWDVALPVREPLSAGEWPQGVAVRWLDFTQGHVPGLERPGSRNLLSLCHQRLRNNIQAMRLRALEQGRFWPAPRYVQLLLARGNRVGLRLQFQKGYQPPYMPWLTHGMSS